MTTIKAYCVTDEYEGQSVIEYSTHAVSARRNGANELNTEFGNVSCKRAAWADGLLPDGPTPQQLMEHGWWFECIGCGQQIDSEHPAVFEGKLVFHNEACQKKAHRAIMTDAVLRCMGCGCAYANFQLDVVLPDDQWALISGRTGGGGILCAACIVERAAEVPGVTVAHLTLA